MYACSGGGGNAVGGGSGVVSGGSGGGGGGGGVFDIHTQPITTNMTSTITTKQP